MVDEITSVKSLAEIASKSPYYKYAAHQGPLELADMLRYNALWTRDVQNVIFAILFCGWLGGMGTSTNPAKAGKLLTIEEVGMILDGASNSILQDHN